MQTQNTFENAVILVMFQRNNDSIAMATIRSVERGLCDKE